MTKQISTKQFSALVFLMAISMKMFLLPALMLRIVGKDGYLVMLANLIIEFLCLGLLVFIAKRNPDKTMFDILSDSFGKVVSRIIIALYALYALLRCVLMISELKMFFTMTMYEQIDWVVMLIPLIALLTAFSFRSLRVVGRVCELLLPVILISTTVLSTLLLGELKLENLLPFLDGGLKPIGKGLATFPMWFGDTAFLLICLGKIKIKKRLITLSFVAKAVASLFVMLFSCTLFATYANISTLIDYGNNVSNMTQFSLGSQDYGRYDLLFYCVWMFSVFISLAFVFRVLTRSVEFIVKAKKHYFVSIICALILYILSSFVLNNENIVYRVMTEIPKYVVCPLAVALPVLLVVASLVKYKSNYHKVSEKGVENESEIDQQKAKKTISL